MAVTVRLARPDDLTACLALRVEVFVHEQAVPSDLEVDGLDPVCTHFTAWEGDRLVGTARMKTLGPGEVKAQRVAVRAEARGTGAGKALMRAMERHARELGFTRIVLDAQHTAVGFYERLGYTPYGATFEDAGIDHRHMWRDLHHLEPPGAVVLLGPQRPTPNLGAVLSWVEARRGAHARTGPAVVVTAGWRHDEGTSEALARVVGQDSLSLPLYAWFEQIGHIVPKARQAHHGAQERIRAVKGAYRIRLRDALRSIRSLWQIQGKKEPSEGWTGPMAAEFGEAIAHVRALDARFLDQIRTIDAERIDPLSFPEVRAIHTRAARRIRDARVVMIAGGHVGVLASRLAFFGLPSVLREAVRAGTPVVAWSGGAMAMSERVVLFHDDPPEGSSDPELLGDGVGLVPGVVVLPHARSRLDLADPLRVSLLARRFQPARSLGIENGSWLVRTRDGWENAGDPGTAFELGVDGAIAPLPEEPVSR